MNKRVSRFLISTVLGGSIVASAIPAFADEHKREEKREGRRREHNLLSACDPAGAGHHQRKRRKRLRLRPSGPEEEVE